MAPQGGDFLERLKKIRLEWAPRAEKESGAAATPHGVPLSPTFVDLEPPLLTDKKAKRKDHPNNHSSSRHLPKRSQSMTLDAGVSNAD